MSRPWMPLHIGDYLAETSHLSPAEHGAYLLLLMHYWNSGVLPNDDQELARIIRASPGEWSRMKRKIAAFFDEGWVHGRIEAELKKSQLPLELRKKGDFWEIVWSSSGQKQE